MRVFLCRAFLLCGLLAAAVQPACAAEADKMLSLNCRSQVETAPDSGQYHSLTKTIRWDPAKTAIIICDMWDKHWSSGATRRVAEMAPRMNEVLKAARKRGVFIIHCPSDTMSFYKDTPERKLAQAAPKATLKSVTLKPEPKLPIDDSDGGCDAEPQCKQYKAWTRQIDTLQIEPGDAVTDNIEAYNLLEQRGIDNVILMGVHTNMCVLGRPFAIRAMLRYGKNVVLMRDLTDTMYNPRKAPFVSHFTGNDLVADHIEQYLCPTITSADLLGGKPFRFADDTRPHVVFVLAETEYKTQQTVPAFALEMLGKAFKLSYVVASEKNRNDLPGLEVLRDADVAFFSIHRRTLPKEQLDIIRSYLAAGKPLVAIRTTSHAFSPPQGGKTPEGLEEWPTFDRDVLGCHYTGHHGSQAQTLVRIADGALLDPLVTGVSAEEFVMASWLYKVAPISKEAKVLLVGRVQDREPEPVAWTLKRKDGGKVFYTTLGHPDEFKKKFFRRFLSNGVHWAAGLPVPE
jgi:nicotinamidase-related amidase/type 1 glutamine amidotransferase